MGVENVRLEGYRVYQNQGEFYILVGILVFSYQIDFKVLMVFFDDRDYMRLQGSQELG